MQKKELAGKRAGKRLANGPPRIRSNGTQELREEIQRLRKSLQALQQKRLQDRQQMKQLKLERDDFERAVYALLRKELRPEDWNDFKKEDYFPMEEVMAKFGIVIKQ